MTRRPRIILAKPGLDGHDKGARLVAMAMRDAGIDVIYLGLRQSVDAIVKAAAEKEADFIGLSILSGVHLNVADKLLKKVAKAGLNCPVVIGGIIPPQDEVKLKEMGIAQVFPVGTSFAATVDWIKQNFAETAKGRALTWQMEKTV